MTRYVKSGTVNTVQEINSELEKIAEAQEDFLARDGETPNSMKGTLDMDSNRITNLPAPASPSDPVRSIDLPNFITEDNNLLLITREERKVLSAGQVSVTFSDLTTTQTAYYISGSSVDQGRLIPNVDYIVTSTTSITLTDSYPEGTSLTAVQNEGVEEVTADIQVFDNVAEMKAASLSVGDTVLCKRYYADGDLVDGLVFDIVNTATVDGYIDHELSNGNFALQLNSDELSADVSGVVGDGVTDDYLALNAAIQRATSNGLKLTSKKKTYKLSRGIFIEDKSDFSIDLGYSTIIAEDSMGTAVAGYMLYIDSCSNFDIDNVITDANRANRTPAEAFSHNIILVNCQGFEFNNCKALNGVTDGLYLGATSNTDISTYTSDGVFNNFVSDNCYRNGKSCINSFDLVFNHCKFNNSNGTAPEAGTILEANSGSAVPANSRITYNNCETVNCNGAGIANTTKTDNVEFTINNHYWNDCRGGALTISGATYVFGGLAEDFDDLSDVANLSDGVIEFQSQQAITKGRISGVRFKNITAANSKCVASRSGVYLDVSVDNCVAEGVVSFCSMLHDYAKVIDNTIDGSTDAILVNGSHSQVKGNNIKEDLGIAIRVGGGIGTTADSNTNVSSVGRFMTISGEGHTITNNECGGVSAVVGAWIQDFSDNSIIDGNRMINSSPSSDLAFRFDGTPKAVKFNEAVNLNTTDSYSFTLGFTSSFFGYNIGGSSNGINNKRS